MKSRPKRFILTSKVKWRTLEDCPIGMFMSEYWNLCVKTEYGNNEGRIDAYVVSTGEFYWGGAKTPEDQRKIYVMPIVVTVER